MAEYVETIDLTLDSETSKHSCSIIQKRVKNEEEEDFLFTMRHKMQLRDEFSLNA